MNGAWFVFLFVSNVVDVCMCCFGVRVGVARARRASPGLVDCTPFSGREPFTKGARHCLEAAPPAQGVPASLPPPPPLSRT